jgi:hypothetical protein
LGEDQIEDSSVWFRMAAETASSEEQKLYFDLIAVVELLIRSELRALGMGMWAVPIRIMDCKLIEL